MSECKKCNATFEDPKDVIQCSVCKIYLHSKCAGLKNVDSISKMGARKANWQCDVCKKGSGHDELNSLISEVKNLTSVVSDMKAEFRDFKTSISAFSGLVDEFKKSMDSFNSIVKDLQTKNAALENENKQLKEQVVQLDIRLLRQEQRSRIESIEVSGIPEIKGEKCEEVIFELAEAVGLQPKGGDVQVAHRVKTFSGKHPYPIVCQLRSRATASAWLTTMKQKRNLSAKDINSQFPDSRVFVNEHLVPRLKRLLMETKRRAKECGYRYTWSKEGRIFVRRADGEQPLEITGQDDLKKMTGKPTPGHTGGNARH